jgi:hypothetical protein
MGTFGIESSKKGSTCSVLPHAHFIQPKFGNKMILVYLNGGSISAGMSFVIDKKSIKIFRFYGGQYVPRYPPNHPIIYK